MSIGNVLREAARRLETGDCDVFACNAILAGDLTDARRPALSFFTSLYRPDSPRPDSDAWGHSGAKISECNGSGWEEDRNPRIVALCLAAAIADSSSHNQGANQ
jgi:hypothetical protein